jgi:hypothetical protein
MPKPIKKVPIVPLLLQASGPFLLNKRGNRTCDKPIPARENKRKLELTQHRNKKRPKTVPIGSQPGTGAEHLK